MRSTIFILTFAIVNLFTSLLVSAEIDPRCAGLAQTFLIAELPSMESGKREVLFKSLGIMGLTRTALSLLTRIGATIPGTGRYELSIYKESFEQALKVLAKTREFDTRRVSHFKEILNSDDPVIAGDGYFGNQILDAILGLYKGEIEKFISERLRMYPHFYGHELTWNEEHIFPETGYQTIRILFENRRPPRGFRIFELGSGYGRMGFYLGIFRPDIQYQGLELVEERVKLSKAVAERIGLPPLDFKYGDLAYFPISRADAFYAYYPTNPTTSLRILRRLSEISKDQSLELWVSYAFEGLEDFAGVFERRGDISTVGKHNVKVYKSR